MSESETTGIETLRDAVDFFGDCDENFNVRFTPAELVQLYRMYEASASRFGTSTPDEWSEAQVRLALEGHPPMWHRDEAPNETAAKLQRLTQAEAERVAELYQDDDATVVDDTLWRRKPVDEALAVKGWVVLTGDDQTHLSRAAYEQRELPEGKDDPSVPALIRSDGLWDEQWLLPTWGVSVRDAEMFAAHMQFFETNPEFAQAACAAWAARKGMVRGATEADVPRETALALIAKVERVLKGAPSRFRKMSYEHGVAAALRWVFGLDDGDEGPAPDPYPVPTVHLQKLTFDEAERLRDLYDAARGAECCVDAVQDGDDALASKGWVVIWDETDLTQEGLRVCETELLTGDPEKPFNPQWLVDES